MPDKTHTMKPLLTAMLLCGTWLAQSQLVLNIQLPPAGLTVKNQLWNLSLVNTFPTQTMVQVEMIMSDASSGQRVLTGVSRFFPVERGVKMVQQKDVVPVVYNTGGSGYNVDAGQDGFLPAGAFNVCYVISRMNGDAIEKLSEECETVEIEPLSPPQLVMPSDSECVELARPLFTWLPPSPAPLFNNLVYDWSLVEIQGMQTGADAIQQNIPLYTQQNITYTSFQYPLSAPALDTSKQYAWWVIAKSNMAPVAVSDISAFRLNCAVKEPVATPYAGPYLKVKREEDGAMGLFPGIVRFEYVNEINDSSIQLTLTDITAAVRKNIPLDTGYLKIHFGQNLLQLDLRDNGAMREKHIYLLELKNARRERWYLKFEYRKPE